MPSAIPILANPFNSQSPSAANAYNLNSSFRSLQENSDPGTGRADFRDVLGQQLSKPREAESSRPAAQTRTDRDQQVRNSKAETRKTAARAGKSRDEDEEKSISRDEATKAEARVRHGDDTAGERDSTASEEDDQTAGEHDKKKPAAESTDQSARADAAAAVAQAAPKAVDPKSPGGVTSDDGSEKPLGRSTKATVAPLQHGNQTKDPAAVDGEDGPAETDAGRVVARNGAIKLPAAAEDGDPAAASPDDDAKTSPLKLGGGVIKPAAPLFGGPANPNAAVATGNEPSGKADSDPTVANLPAVAAARISEVLPDLSDDESDADSSAGPRPAAADHTAASPFFGPDATSGKEAAHGKDAVFAAPPAPEPPPEAKFAEANHARILTGIRGELLPGGGSMQLRLDPPALGDLLVSVQMRDGVMTASFQTSNENATRMLSHSLGDLKSMLESQGVTVEKLQVQQAPKQEPSQNQTGDGQHRQPGQEEQQSAKREQQRKDMVQKLWDKLAGRGPVDVRA